MHYALFASLGSNALFGMLREYHMCWFLNTLLSISGPKLTLKKQPFSVWQQQSEVALRLVMNAVSSNAAVGTLQLPFVTGRWLPKPGCNLLLMLSRVSTTATVAERSSLAMETWNHSIDLATRLRLRF